MAEAKAEAKAKEIEKTAHDWLNEKVTVKLFKDSGKYANDEVVGVNGKLWAIKRGVEVEIPRFVAMVLERSLEQSEQTANLIEQEEAKVKSDKAFS